jgi:hypothetical protein
MVDGNLAVRGVVDYQNLCGWIDGPDGNHLNDPELRFWRSDNYTSKMTERTTGSVTYGTSLTNVRAGLSVDESQRDCTATLFGANLSHNYGAVPGSPSVLNIRSRPRTLGLQVDYKYEP